jgi:hypothetical protein
MGRQHRALVRWIPAAQGGLSALPTVRRLVHPGHFTEDGPTWPTKEGWSIVLDFDRPPVEDPSASSARVSFLMDSAPHDRLRPGRLFDFYEGARKIAIVEVLEPLG